MDKEKERKGIIEFLQWNDRNGCYTDENCDSEDVPRMTYEEAIKYFFGVVNADAYSQISESMADIEYEQVINFAKQNGFYDETLDKLSKLISKTSHTVEVYKSIL
ncbi:MAG: hypothetical protein KIC66_07920 [Clostridium sp.]|uniref:hypothetical protein n=1 Tax=Clostridium TaxID=1485 RepID=UPI001C1E543B|nr:MULTISPECIES: hypothetical protein [Clostridium]MBS5926998.1 hypothetical protein [Clostridium sp.]MBU6134537.1 hypothetical protein [Clostridium tertium]